MAATGMFVSVVCVPLCSDVALIVVVLLTYEYLITSGAEIRLFWGPGFSAAAALFFFNRFLNLINWWNQTISIFYYPKDIQVRQKYICRV